MLLKNWTLDKYNPDYFWDFEDATIENMTNGGSAGSATWTKSNTPGKFDISEQYYGMWASDSGVLNYGTGTLQTTNSTIGAYLDNANFTVNFFIEFSKFGISGNKNLLEFNYGSNSIALLILGTGVGSTNQNKLRVTSGGTTVLTSTNQHWSYSATSPVVSGGFLDTPNGWSGVNPGFMMVSIRFVSGNVELYINGVLDTSAAITNVSGAFTNFRVFGSSTSVNVLMDQLSIAPNNVYTSTALLELWNMFLLGQIPAEPMTASALLPAPSPMIAEINPAQIIEATAEMLDAVVIFGINVSVVGEPMIASNAQIIQPTLLLDMVVGADPFYITNAQFINPLIPVTIRPLPMFGSAQSPIAFSHNQIGIGTYLEEVLNLNPPWHYSLEGTNFSSIPNLGFVKYRVTNYFDSPVVESTLDGKKGRGVKFKPYVMAIKNNNWTGYNPQKQPNSLRQQNPLAPNNADNYGPLEFTTKLYGPDAIADELLGTYGNAPGMDGISVSFWIKTSKAELETGINAPTTTGYDILGVVGSNSGQTNSNYFFRANTTNQDGQQGLFVEFYSSGLGGRIPTVSIVPNQWNHVVFTSKYLNSTYRVVSKMYVNGDFVSSQSFYEGGYGRHSLSAITNIYRLNLGGRAFRGLSTVPPTNFTGILDEVSVFPKELTPNDIFRLYAAGTSTTIAEGVGTMTATARILSALNSNVDVEGVEAMTSSALMTPAVFTNQPTTFVYPEPMVATTLIERALRPYRDVYWNKIYSLTRYGSTLGDPELDQGNGVRRVAILNRTDPGDPKAYKGADDNHVGYFYAFNLAGDLKPGKENSQYEYVTGGGGFFEDVGLADDYIGWEGNIQQGKINQSLPGLTSTSNGGPFQRKMGIWNGNFWLWVDSTREQGDDEGQPTTRENFGSYTGSLQLTINTTKENSTLICSTPELVNSSFFLRNSPAFGQSVTSLYLDADSDYMKRSDSSAYQNLTTLEIEDGKIVFNHFDVPTGETKKFIGTKNIADGENHFIILNRTMDGFGTDNKENKKKKACLEIWIDGELEIRSYEFDSKYWMNAPEFIGAKFKYEWLSSSIYDSLAGNDGSTNSDGAGSAYVAGYSNLSPNAIASGLNGWGYTLDQSTVFEGRLSDYVYASHRPFTGTEISNLYQAWKGIEPIQAPEPPQIFAAMAEPQVSTNHKNILRLFWNLNQEKQNGIQPSQPLISVETYSVVSKLLTSPGETFNLNSSTSKINLRADVLTLIDKYVNIQNPGAIEAMITVRGKIGGTYTPVDPRQSYAKDNVDLYPVGYNEKLLFDNYEIKVGDRILLINQHRSENNGVWVYNGPKNPMYRPANDTSAEELFNSTVYVKNGTYKDTYWKLVTEYDKITFERNLGGNLYIGTNCAQDWKQINVINNDLNSSCPIIDNYWRDIVSNDIRFIDINNDIDIDKYDVIAFMNYPESINEVYSQFDGYDISYVTRAYDNFVSSLKIAVENGKSLMINSEKLAIDLELIKKAELVSQSLENYDQISLNNNVFETSSIQTEYFNTNRNNKYRVVQTLAGLTDKDTWIMKDFINYVPKESWKNDQYHIKYQHRLDGLEVGDEFFIPTLPLRKVQNKESGFNYFNKNNSESILAIKETDIISGRIITKLSNTVNNNVPNIYKDYVTTFVLQPGDSAWGTTISGKIFVNLVEDALTMSQQGYNVGIIQNSEQYDEYETEDSTEWQYSTTRLINRENDLFENIDYEGQQYPSFAGGGPIVQSSTNVANGIIRNIYDINDDAKRPIFYGLTRNEKYFTTPIPTLSMTYLGLLWLGGI